MTEKQKETALEIYKLSTFPLFVKSEEVKEISGAERMGRYVNTCQKISKLAQELVDSYD